MRSSRQFLAASMGLVLLAAADAKAETTSCTAITALPHTISAPGAYCLTGMLSFSQASGAAITVSTDLVVIDLNGWTLRHSSPTNAATGIASTGTRITVRNGTIDGFATGISVASADVAAVAANLVEGMRVNRSMLGITVQGANSVVRDNQVLTTRGGSAFGIQVAGPGAYVGNNSIYDTVASGTNTAVGIDVAYAHGAVVEGNFVSNGAASPSVLSKGINLKGSSKVTVARNRVANMRVGIESDTGGNLAYGNTVVGSATPFAGVSNAVENSGF